MRKALLTLATLMLGATTALADPVEGTWKTQVDDGAYAHVQIAPCGPAFCGTIVKTFNSSGEYKSPNLGKQLVRGMTPAGSGKYEGKVWRPSNNKIYVGKLELNGNALTMKGCVAGGLICSGQTWSRLN
ncbi:DUF2147 domain-containing protein [Pseudooceanicola onchidii]|uniref:DUF2147 domain-containing protein n=1 Tax=Pseudooceanicola onchidii TaxID=2562279 RepID=UPI0010AA379B|nr:DUF2147 domain-containing protein [Pseudooceanicola onchidii]